MTTCRTVPHACLQRAARRPRLTSLGLALGLALAMTSEAQASTYYVYTSQTSAMSKAPNDGYCSLAEAVEHVNGNGIYNCTDQAPGSAEHRIELRQAANLSFAANHYKIRMLTINSSKRVTITGSGGLPFIDFIGVADGGSAFLVTSGDNVFFNRVNLTNTAGSSGGRLVENRGTLQFYGVTMANGDVTASYHLTGRGGAIYNNGGTISVAQNSVITGNKARLGGAIYNNDGRIYDFFSVTISGNSATKAGGGIYNLSTGIAPDTHAKGYINVTNATISGNSARAGGGVFNRGEVDMHTCTVMSNTASGTGSDETCHTPPNGTPTSCDGNGGGILSLAVVGRVSPTRMYSGSTLYDNTASERGGGIYNSSQMLFDSVTFESNQAKFGGAIYTAGLVDGETNYCEVVSVNPDLPQSSFVGNEIAPGGNYSIVDSSGAVGAYCLFDAIGWDNDPQWCEDGAVKPGFSCPQTQ